MGKISTILVAHFFILITVLYSSQVSIASCIKGERESLLRLKASFIDSSNRLASRKGTDCCNWEGVGCDHTNGGHVVKLDLRNYEYSPSSALLSNGVDSSLFELKYLNYLDLSANFFNYTQTPIYFAELSELRYLNLSFTYFHGTIPRSLGNLNKLVDLDFNNDNVILDVMGYLYLGVLFIDGLGWVSSFPSLEYLDFSGIRIVQNENSSEPSIDQIKNNSNEEDELEKMWFWIIVMVGYGLGFWGVVGPLILKRSWRSAYFQFMDETKDKIYVTVLVNITRLKQRMGGNKMRD
ncbi:unnamed protein product [Citrullus colocynthis]|uniref:Leucine-rich repeat-containing N-terminal plant-type domain-containing protein n=1 Tax=Citrullus colocynthis TaxID=252529 RepID=A0ABP0XRG6_9ROSI